MASLLLLWTKRAEEEKVVWVMGGVIAKLEALKKPKKRADVVADVCLPQPALFEIGGIKEVSSKEDGEMENDLSEEENDQAVVVTEEGSMKTDSRSMIDVTQNNRQQRRTSSSRAENKRFRAAQKGFKGFRAAIHTEYDEEGNPTEDGAMHLGVIGKVEPKNDKEKTEVAAAVKELLRINDEDLDNIFDAMYERAVDSETIVYKQSQPTPFFYVVVTGVFCVKTTESIEDSVDYPSEEVVVKYANAQCLLSVSHSKEAFLCKESGRLWYISRLSYQNVMVNRLKCRIKEGESLLQTIIEIPGLRELPRSQREEIARALCEVSFQPGELLMKQGEEGHTLFFIQSGEVIVTRENLTRFLVRDQPRRGSATANAEVPGHRFFNTVDVNRFQREAASSILARRTAGEYIGEGALLDSLIGDDSETQKPGIRNANLFAASEVKCLSLGQSDFEAYMGSLKELFEHNYCSRVLKALDIMASLTDAQLLMITSMLEECVFDLGEKIVTQDELGDNFYIVKDGTLECTLLPTEKNHEPESIGTLIAGDYFGEGALLTNAPRRCNITVVGTQPARLWALSRNNFHNFLSKDIKEVLGKRFSARKRATDPHSPSDKGSSNDLIGYEDLQFVMTLGSGSYGTVELMRHKVTGQTYALKRIKKATVVAKKQQRFIQNERELLSTLSSPFIANLIRTFNTKAAVYMLFELCLGGELYAYMKDTVDQRLAEHGVSDDSNDSNDEDIVGCFDIPTQTRFFAACIILGIEYLHKEGIVHRDIKPENILLNNKGYLKLVDLGFSKRVFEQRTYSLCGTPEYTAPEVYRRIGHGKQVDYWALGVILYEMASGFSPFHVDSQNSWDCYVEVSKYEKHYPNIQFPEIFGPSLTDMVLQLMHPNPLKRYGTRKRTSMELKQHEFFSNLSDSQPFDWQQVEAQEYLLPEQFRPSTPEFGLDARNFSECADRHLFDDAKVPQELIAKDVTGWDQDF